MIQLTKTIFISSFAICLAFRDMGPIKDPAEVSKEIAEANQAIDENMYNSEDMDPMEESHQNIDGPYPADEYSLEPTGKFHILSVYTDGKDSTWLSIEAKSENEIVKKYPRLKAYKIRPNWIDQTEWLKIRQNCLQQNRVFDLSDQPKGWLLENKEKLR